jgi:uncharacterized membrane protein YczE
VLFGLGVALILHSDLGASPWDVFHQGISELTGISVGIVIVGVGLVLLAAWIPLRQRPGVGTLLNALLVGTVVDVVQPLLPDTERVPLQLLALVTGVLLMAVGSGLYIGSGLGPGPRDGIMMGLAARGISVRLARTLIEVFVLIVGFLMGATVGIGTLIFTFSIGPLVHVLLPRLALPPRRHDLAALNAQ